MDQFYGENDKESEMQDDYTVSNMSNASPLIKNRRNNPKDKTKKDKRNEKDVMYFEFEMKKIPMG